MSDLSAITQQGVYIGDCRALLSRLLDDSIHAIVTDPPYELGFMGKSWDSTGIAYDVAMWKECLRVLKPGGYLLAFGGSRTYHRLACAVEDAGFEIRDQIMWVYSQGFPKSLNLDTKRGKTICGCETLSECSLRDLHNSDVSEAESISEGRGEVLQHRMPQSGLSIEGTETGTGDEGASESGVERGSDVLPQTRQLQANKVCSLPDGLSGDGAEGWLRNGASPDYGATVATDTDEAGSGASSRPQSAEQPSKQSRIVAGQSQSQAGGAWPLCNRCGKPIFPRGLGSALKPAHEPIVVARKPLIGTLEKNILTHGCGAINIDGCRIEGEPVPINRLENWSGFGQEIRLDYEATINDLGRWLANLIHDGSDEVLAAFPDAKGQQGDLNATGRTRPSSGRFGDMGPPKAHKARRDGEPSAHRRYTENGATNFAAMPGERRLTAGSAARFFYCAKVSKSEREFGCENLPHRAAGEVTGGRAEGSDGLNSPRAGAGSPSGSRNFHPTVKPISLMRYLCRLVTPPKGIVLDPFTGSGSTGCAARLEGFQFIGFEMEPDYAKIACARISASRSEHAKTGS